MRFGTELLRGRLGMNWTVRPLRELRYEASFLAKLPVSTTAALCDLGSKCLAEGGGIPGKRVFLIRAIEGDQCLPWLAQRQLRVP